MKILKPIFVILMLALVIFGFYQLVIFPMMKTNTQIVHMIDPDTLLVMENGKLEEVQLIGADAPELTGEYKDRQCFDFQARRLAAVRYFSGSRDLTLSTDDSLGDTDVYGRKLRYVTLADGTLYNQELIRDGLAKESDPQNKNYSKKEGFLKAQQEAQQNSAGIWNKQTCDGRY